MFIFHVYAASRVAVFTKFQDLPPYYCIMNDPRPQIIPSPLLPG